MNGRCETGRRLVLVVIVANLTVSVLVIAAFLIVRGPERLPEQIVRFLLTIGLFVFLYRGANWARWITGILFGAAGLLAVVGGLRALSTGLDGLLLIVMGLVYVASAGVLFLVPTVRAFFGAEIARAG